MKKIINKVHHFSKLELAVEEIIIICFLCIVITAASFAASGILPVRTKLVQCGHREDLPQACREDKRCCALLKKLGGDAPQKQNSKIFGTDQYSGEGYFTPLDAGKNQIIYE